MDHGLGRDACHETRIEASFSLTSVVGGLLPHGLLHLRWWPSGPPHALHRPREARLQRRRHVPRRSRFLGDQHPILRGLGLAISPPRPLFNFSAYVGTILAVNHGYFFLMGVVIACLGLFLPGIMLIFGALPFWTKFRNWSIYNRALPGLNAAGIGLMHRHVRVRPHAGGVQAESVPEDVDLYWDYGFYERGSAAVVVAPGGGWWGRAWGGGVGVAPVVSSGLDQFDLFRFSGVAISTKRSRCLHRRP